MCVFICLRGCVSVRMSGYACLCICEWLCVYCIKLDFVIWEVQDLLCYNHVGYSVIIISNTTMHTQFLDKCSHCGRREHILERHWVNPSRNFVFPRKLAQVEGKDENPVSARGEFISSSVRTCKHSHMQGLCQLPKQNHKKQRKYWNQNNSKTRPIAELLGIR